VWISLLFRDFHLNDTRNHKGRIDILVEKWLKAQYGSVKGEREKVSNTSKSPYPLTFSQTTKEVHTAYTNLM